jgi:hypothetical protein
VRRALAVTLLVVAATAAAAYGAATSVTLAARNTVVTPLAPSTTLLGKIDEAKAGEVITIQGQECGVAGGFWRSVSSTQTLSNGTWTMRQFIRTATVFRATWKDSVSATVTVRPRASVEFFKRSKGFLIRAGGAVGNWHNKRVVVERYDRRLGKWSRLTSVVLKGESGGWASREGLRFRVPKGTRLRAVLSAVQAAPCYLAGYSGEVRT